MLVLILNNPTSLYGSIYNWGLFSIRISKQVHLGILNHWILLTCKCKYGICIETCYCLPSWRGRYCHVPIAGFSSIWNVHVSPLLYEIGTFIESYHPIGTNIKNSQLFEPLLSTVTEIELIVAIIVLAHIYSRFREANWLLLSESFAWHGLITCTFFHGGFLETLLAVLGFVYMAPIIYQKLGRMEFVKFFISSMLISNALAFLLFKRTSGLYPTLAVMLIAVYLL